MQNDAKMPSKWQGGTVPQNAKAGKTFRRLSLQSAKAATAHQTSAIRMVEGASPNKTPASFQTSAYLEEVVTEVGRHSTEGSAKEVSKGTLSREL